MPAKALQKKKQLQQMLYTKNIGKSYTVHKGDRLNKTSDDAVVTITQKTQEESKEVVLVSGSAEIVYK